MSGIVVILGERSQSELILLRGAEAAPGRGSVQAVWQSDQAAFLYQGLDAENEFCVSDHYVCIVLGWPYGVDPVSKQSRRLSAGDLIRLFAANEAFNLEGIFGQYTIALFCRRQSRLHVARDVFGSLPLHWAQTGWGSVHACDIRQLAAALAAPLTLSLAALSGYQQELALPASCDLYVGMHQHLPGTCASFSAQFPSINVTTLTPSRLLRGFSSLPTPADALDQLIAAVGTSIEMCQQRAKTAISLSGGMDSTLIILSAMQSAKCTGINAPVGVSCIFPGLSCDESAKISQLVGAMQIRNETISCREPGFQHWQERLFSATDYVPFPAGQIGLQVAQLAQQLGYAQLIDGNGGDELFDWNVLDLAQMATRTKEYGKLLRALLTAGSGPRVLALRHLVKRILLGRWAQGARDPLAVCQKALSPSLNRAFYLAAEQIASSASVALYSPLRDLRLLQLLLPWMPGAAFQAGNRRGLQSDAVYKISSGSIRLGRNDKVNFDEFALVPFNSADTEGLPALGLGKLVNFAGLMPKFLKHKVEVEGVLVK